MRHQALAPVLDERSLRLWASAEAKALGRGGIAAVTEATGIRGKRIRAGLRELAELDREPPSEPPAQQRVRRAGAGRKKLTAKDPELLRDLDALVNPATRGDPESPLRWTSKSTAKLAEELQAMGHAAGETTVRRLLREELGYSLQANSKTREGTDHPDRDAQFGYLSTTVDEFHAVGWPTISVDTKKKELVGDFANGGREWHPAGQPDQVRTHDFIDSNLGKAIPYGVYDIGRNEGFVNVGIDHDTAAFAVEGISQWWRTMGCKSYRAAGQLLVIADAGGSNGYRLRQWKLELQNLADRLHMPITVCHMPPGTSKWNKIEHRLFSHISMNWRGRPLLSHQTVVQLIGSTRTRAGLKVRARLDTKSYPTGVKVSDAAMQDVEIVAHDFHGEWNYTIFPHA